MLCLKSSTEISLSVPKVTTIITGDSISITLLLLYAAASANSGPDGGGGLFLLIIYMKILPPKFALVINVYLLSLSILVYFNAAHYRKNRIDTRKDI